MTQTKAESNELAPIKTSYEDAATVQSKEAVDAGLHIIRKLEMTVQKGKGDAKTAVLAVINAKIKQGVILRRICGHEQVNFQFMRNMEDRLPWWGKTKEAQADALETAMNVVNLSKRFDGKSIKWEDIETDVAKSIMQQVDLLLPGSRGPSDLTGEPLDNYGKWLAEITRAKVVFEKAITEKPLASRSKAQLRDFLSNTQYVEDYRKEAVQLLEGK